MLEYIIQIIAAGIGTWCFAITFNVPKKEHIYCAINGAVSWFMYIMFGCLGAGITLSCVGAAFTITILARIFSALRKHPVTVYLINAIFPLVPGAALYYTAYNLMMDDFATAGNKGLEAFKIAGGITLGIMFGFGIPQSIFNGLAKLSKKSEDGRYQQKLDYNAK